MRENSMKRLNVFLLEVIDEHSGQLLEVDNDQLGAIIEGDVLNSNPSAENLKQWVKKFEFIYHFQTCMDIIIQ